MGTEPVSAASVPLAVNCVRWSAANQRIGRTDADGSYWRYEYDALGQVRSGRKYWSDGTLVAGQQFEYGHDDIGNRTSARAGGDAGGAGLRVANYIANLLNQYSSRDVPGAVDIMGLGFATNAVTVNGATAYRKGEYFRQEVSLSNGSTPVWEGITVTESGQAPVSGNLFVPQTPEQFTYDQDGNLLSDGRWNYTWDAENRLIALAARTAVGPQESLKFEYDSKARRIRKQVWSNTTWSGSPINDVEFIYDGWNLLAESATGGALVRSYVWGSDLSGSMQGAGGVGGLLQVTYYGTQTTNCFAVYDGNGNVAALVSAADGKLVAQYEYGPFGELLRTTGPMAKPNPLRFSTKYEDDGTDLLYYGYRYCSGSTGRWPSHDPAEEDAGPDLYAFLSGDALNNVDLLGRCGGGGGGGAAPVCGVEKIVFSQAGFLTKQPGQAQLSEVLLIKYQRDDSHDPAVCVLVARSKVFSVVNGVKIPASEAGMPYDNEWHTDTWNWTKEADVFLAFPSARLKGSLYDNMRNQPDSAQLVAAFGFNIADWDYVAFDLPGWKPGRLKPGDQVVRHWSQKAIVFDRNTKSIVKEVDAGPGAPFSIVGTYPDLKFHPPKKK